MGEQAPAIQSKRLLVVALVLAAIVVLLVNVRDKVRSAGEGDKVELLKFRRDMEAGDRITDKDITLEWVEREDARALGNVVSRKHQDLVVGSTMNQAARKGEFVRYAHVTGGSPGGAADLLSGEDMVARVIPIDPRNAPGDILRVYDRVSILARLSVKRKPLRTYRVIEGLRVMAIGGRGEQARTLVSGSRLRSLRQPRYGSITVEVPRTVSLALSNILSHAAGSVEVELCKPSPELYERAGQINKELEELAEFASPGREANSY